MDTIIFQAKSQALLGHLLEKGYSKHYASLFSYEIGRMLNYISSYGSLDGYLQNYSSVFGMKLDSRKTRIINLIQGYLFNGQLANVSAQGGFNSWVKQNVTASEAWNPDDFGDFVSYYDKQNQDVLFINKDTALAWSEQL